jgi:hypothetical protein
MKSMGCDVIGNAPESSKQGNASSLGPTMESQVSSVSAWARASDLAWRRRKTDHHAPPMESSMSDNPGAPAQEGNGFLPI